MCLNSNENQLENFIFYMDEEGGINYKKIKILAAKSKTTKS